LLSNIVRIFIYYRPELIKLYDVKYLFLENINLFQKLCPHKFKEYKNCHDFDLYKKSDYVYFSEDAADKVYLIEKGKVKIGYYTEEGEEVVKAILTKGELFGEKAILGQEKRNEFAQSLDNKTSICPMVYPQKMLQF